MPKIKTKRPFKLVVPVSLNEQKAALSLAKNLGVTAPELLLQLLRERHGRWKEERKALKVSKKPLQLELAS